MFNKKVLKYKEKEKSIIDKYTEIQKIKMQENIFTYNDLIFMNDGFANLNDNGYPVDFENEMYELSNKYKKFLYQVNLYKKTLEYSNIDLNNKSQTIVDIGCGKGGGIAFYKDFYKFTKCIGVDLTEINVNFARTHTFNIDFYVSSATKLPLKDNSVDIITCIESVGYYDPISEFVKESFRILKNNGKILISQPFNSEQEINLENIFLKNNFILENKKDITKNVAISSAISKFIFMDFSLQESKIMYNDEQRYLDETNTRYKTYVFVKNK